MFEGVKDRYIERGYPILTFFSVVLDFFLYYYI